MALPGRRSAPAKALRDPVAPSGAAATLDVCGPEEYEFEDESEGAIWDAALVFETVDVSRSAVAAAPTIAEQVLLGRDENALDALLARCEPRSEMSSGGRRS